MRLRSFTDADWPEFKNFASNHFGPSHVTDRAFNEHWFQTSRYDGWAVKVLEDEEGRVAGMMMVIVVRAKFGTSTVPLAWISSAAVEERARMRGTGSQFYLWVYKAFPLVGAMSGNENSLPLNQVLGMEIPGVRMRRFISVHYRQAANLCVPEKRRAVLSAASRIVKRATGALVLWSSGDIPEDYEELWGRFREKIYCTTERDRDYVEWRYLRAPYVNYKLWAMRVDKHLQAFAVVRFQRTPEGMVCRVLDFVSDEEWAAEAWRLVAEKAQAEEALFTDFMVVGSQQDEHLLSAGFLPADADTGLDAIPHLLSPLEHREWNNTFHLGGQLARTDQSWRYPDQVYFTKGDSDRDWPTTHDLVLRT